MKKIKIRMLFALLLSVSAATGADEPPVEDDPGFMTDAPGEEELQGAEEVPLELDPVEVTDMGMSYRQEVTLRIIRQAYRASRSERREDIDKWICWLPIPTGTHFRHLTCARNGDLWAMRPDSSGGVLGPPIGIAGYGKIFRTERPTNRWKLEQAMAELPGSSDFDREFIGMVMAGQQPPRDIPDDEELGQFARAWVRIGKMHKAGESEDEQISAIEDEDLSLERYNRIADLIETYQSVENQVDALVKKLSVEKLN